MSPPLRLTARWWPVLLICLGVTLLPAAACTPGNDNPEETSPVAQIIRLSSGPLQELRIARDTDGRFVVTGFCYFPDDTRLSIALHDSLGQVLGQTRSVVENGWFTSLPFGGGELPAGAYEIGVTANFSPADQPAAVLDETDGGRALEGEGMFITQRGHPAFALRFPVEP